MRHILIAILAAATLGWIGATPASAKDFKYCLQSPSDGIPGDCFYDTLAQCKASASGRNASCAINPRVAFGLQRRRY